MFDPQAVVRRLAASPSRRERLTHVENLPGRAAEYAAWPEWAHPGLVAAFGQHGITQPWRHQATAADLARSGRHTIIATGTASGKSLCYWLPTLTTVIGSVQRPGERGDCVLYLSPTKALAHDQLDTVAELDIGEVRASAYDGDSDREERDWARRHANYLVTNPDMVHRTLLPSHARWAAFWGSLRYVVVDECHHYRGVFGAHVAQIMRRLRRVAHHYESDPTFILASATVAEPAETASRLIGAPTEAVTEDTSPHGPSVFALWEPPLSPGSGERDAPVRRSATAESGDLLADLVTEGVRTLAFVRSRRGAESVAEQTSALLSEVDESLPERVAPYRGGYLPEDRRLLEDRLRSGDLLAVAATNALELGIDIEGLDAVLVAGYPGTRASLWQQVGRAGRAERGGIGVLLARDDPLDTFLVRHPEALLHAPVEATVFDPGNPYVLAPHLCAAAQEIPLTDEDLAAFEGEPAEVAQSLAASGHLRRRSTGWFWTGRGSAAALADIRSSGGEAVRIVEAATGRLVGTVDAASAHTTVHTGAVYVHLGDTYVVAEFDDSEGVALVEPANPDYTTTARDVTDISVVAPLSEQAWGQARMTFGTVEVSSQVVSYLKRRRGGGEVLGEEPLTLPARQLRTKAVWWTLSDDAASTCGLAARDLPGAAHAAEHAAIGLLPLFATCDRWDIGGVSTARHPDTDALTIFVYDAYPGGAGFAERGFHAAREWLAATRAAIGACECGDGCPSCVQSPKCGNGNDPLDKAGAVVLLDTLLGSDEVATPAGPITVCSDDA